MAVVGGLVVIGSLADDPDKETATLSTSKYEGVDADFRKLAGDDMFVMTFNAKADPVELQKTIRDYCGSRKFCKVLGWTDPEYAPGVFQ